MKTYIISMLIGIVFVLSLGSSNLYRELKKEQATPRSHVPLFQVQELINENDKLKEIIKELESKLND